MRRGVAAAALTAGLAVAFAGCSSTDTPTAASPEPVHWQRVQLPGGAEPVTVTRMGDALLVGARDEQAHVMPRLLVLDHGHWSSIPLHPQGYYAYRAHFRSVVTDGTRIYAFGDASGGAHFNPRWTTWSGTTAGVTEHPQNFETFGGWGAGGLTAMTYDHGTPVIVGAWTSEGPGLDIVEWTPHGVDWERHTSTGTALANTDDVLNVMRAVGDDADGTALAGAVTRLGGGQVSLDPVIWRSTEADPTWVRIDLPAHVDGQATGVQCRADTCLAAGYVGDRLAAWSVHGRDVVREAGLPDTEVGSDSIALVGPVGATTSAILTVSQGGAVLLQQTADGWVHRAGPTGTPTAWVDSGGVAYVLTTSGGRSSLWRGDLSLRG